MRAHTHTHLHTYSHFGKLLNKFLFDIAHTPPRDAGRKLARERIKQNNLLSNKPFVFTRERQASAIIKNAFLFSYLAQSRYLIKVPIKINVYSNFL